MALEFNITVICDFCGLSYRSDERKITAALIEARSKEYAVIGMTDRAVLKCPNCILKDASNQYRDLGVQINRDVLR